MRIMVRRIGRMDNGDWVVGGELIKMVREPDKVLMVRDWRSRMDKEIGYLYSPGVEWG